MSNTQTMVADAPVASLDRLKARCAVLVDALGGMEMPVDELRIREAGGCVGGMLVGIMVSGTLSVPADEAAAVADLCAVLGDSFPDADDRRIIAAIHTHACAARDSGVDIDVTFR